MAQREKEGEGERGREREGGRGREREEHLVEEVGVELSLHAAERHVDVDLFLTRKACLSSLSHSLFSHSLLSVSLSECIIFSLFTLSIPVYLGDGGVRACVRVYV